MGASPYIIFYNLSEGLAKREADYFFLNLPLNPRRCKLVETLAKGGGGYG